MEKLEDRWVIGSMLTSLPGIGMAGMASQSLSSGSMGSSFPLQGAAEQPGRSSADPLGLNAWDSSLLKTADSDTTQLDMSASGGASAVSESLEESPPTCTLFQAIRWGQLRALGATREFCRGWPNQTEVTVAGNHFLQEDSPDEIGQAIAGWLAGIG